MARTSKHWFYKRLMLAIAAGGAVTAASGALWHGGCPAGPALLILSFIPCVSLLACEETMADLIPDVVFGATHAGLLLAPAIWGAQLYGAAGVIAGGLAGAALSDGIAGFAEGSAAAWLRSRSMTSSRAPLSSGLGKMAGFMIGAGLTLSLVWVFGVRLY